MSQFPVSTRRFDYDKRFIPNRFVASMEKGIASIKQAVRRTGYSVGYPGWNLLYYTTLCSLDQISSNVIVETGTNWGFSAIILAQALRHSKLEGHLYSVELDKNNYRKARRNIAKAGVSDLIDLRLGDAKEFLARFTSELEGTIRFVFLDSSHRRKDVVREFEIIYPKLADDSTVFFDNTYRIVRDRRRDQRVNGALKLIMERYGGNLVNFPNTSWSTPGQAIWQKAPFANDWSR